MPDATANKVITKESTLEDLRSYLMSSPGSVYAILDACDEPRVPRKIQELQERAVSLYRGWAERDYWAIAPYLAQVSEPLLDWIVENLWGDPWGFFAVAQTDLSSLRRHFRQFLTVQDPDGAKMYFRFYDPRVLPTFLGTCSGPEVEQFFGPITELWVVGEDLRMLTIQR